MRNYKVHKKNDQYLAFTRRWYRMILYRCGCWKGGKPMLTHQSWATAFPNIDFSKTIEIEINDVNWEEAIQVGEWVRCQEEKQKK